MKKSVVILALVAITASSCGTLLGGKITDCQKTKPADGSKRKLRPAAVFFDIVGPLPIIALVVDLKTGGAYKPCQATK